MHLDTQFSIFMVNKPGVLSQILNELAATKINIVAMTMMDSVEHGVMRIVGASHSKIRKTLDKMNMHYSETQVLCLNLPNKVGAFAAVTEKLSKAHINISYAYCTAGARGGRTTGILKVADVKKAIKIIEGHVPDTSHKTKKKKTKKAVRRSPGSRK